jgi:hypothetical protein
MEQHIFAFSLIIEDTTENVLQFKSIYNKNLGFIEQKFIFENYREVQIRKCLLINIIFAIIIFSNDLFRVALYRLMLVLLKDALFDYKDSLLF